ncbi:MAG: HDOD domain-containing protein [Myxococcaceae bacterium]
MRRVVIVEGDGEVAEGLRRSLRGYAAEWELTVVGDALAVEAELAQPSAPDVVICDASVNGVENLLLHLKLKAPRVVRAVLAGAEVNAEVIARLQGTAHQVLRKPLLPAMLFDLVERTVAVINALGNERLQVVIGQLGDLPPLPATYSQLSQMTQDPDVSLTRVTAVVERDPSIVAAVLRMINSAYFGLPRRVSTVAETVRYLGIGPLKNLVLTVELFEGLATGRRAVTLQQEALLRAYAMRDLLGRTPKAEQAFMAGILSDVGALLLLTRLPIDAMAIDQAVEAGRLPWVVQQERLSCTSAHIGAQLLTRWNLPQALVEAVALQNEEPRGTPAPTLGTALALVSAIEWSVRAPEPLRGDFRKRAAELVTAFPAASLEAIGRYFNAAPSQAA